MKPGPDQPSIADDPRLLHAAQEYLADLEAGRSPDRAALVSRFPDLSGALAPYLDALDLLYGAAPLLHQPPESGPMHFARSAGAGWGSCTRPCSGPWAGGWR
jgi:hypothetical protein